jgi:hypothetical protein
MIQEILETWPEEAMAPNGHHPTATSTVEFEWGQ